MRNRNVPLAVLAGAWASWMMVASGQTPSPPAIPNIAGQIMAVNGPMAPADLGHTLTHEHILIDFTVPDGSSEEKWRLAGRVKPLGATDVAFYNAPLTLDILGAVTMGKANRENYLIQDEQTQIAELAEFKRHGGNTIVDVTSIGLKRDPEALRRISRATGVNVVMGSSWYHKAWHPADMDSRSIERLTAEIVRDITVGVGDTGIRSGIIGEVGTTGNPLTPNEIKVIRASGRASRLTGAAISLHTSAQLREQPKILDMLAEEGADLRRVVIGHSDSLINDMPFIKQLMSRGATVQFDLLGRHATVNRWRQSNGQMAEAVVQLIKDGLINQVVLSHDVCTKTSLKAYGGTGYSFIDETFLPYLKRLGVTDQQINTLVVENPKRFLTFAAPQAALQVKAS